MLSGGEGGGRISLLVNLPDTAWLLLLCQLVTPAHSPLLMSQMALSVRLTPPSGVLAPAFLPPGKRVGGSMWE